MGHGHREDGAGAPAEHRAAAETSVKVYLVICSDTRSEATDGSGAWLKKALSEAGHVLAGYEIVKDEVDQVRAALERGRAAGAQAILTSGGTGITRRDTTYEAVQALLEKELTGFGELFRMRSFEFIGAAAMLSRATAGLWKGCFVACLPGSTGAVRLAWEELLAPELPHLVHLAAK